MCRQVISLIVSFIFLFALFYALIAFKALEVKNIYRYPSTLNCKAVDQIFKNNLTQYEEYAVID